MQGRGWYGFYLYCQLLLLSYISRGRSTMALIHMSAFAPHRMIFVFVQLHHAFHPGVDSIIASASSLFHNPTRAMLVSRVLYPIHSILRLRFVTWAANWRIVLSCCEQQLFAFAVIFLFVRSTVIRPSFMQYYSSCLHWRHGHYVVSCYHRGSTG